MATSPARSAQRAGGGFLSAFLRVLAPEDEHHADDRLRAMGVVLRNSFIVPQWAAGSPNELLLVQRRLAEEFAEFRMKLTALVMEIFSDEEELRNLFDEGARVLREQEALQALPAGVRFELLTAVDCSTYGSIALFDAGFSGRLRLEDIVHIIAPLTHHATTADLVLIACLTALDDPAGPLVAFPMFEAAVSVGFEAAVMYRNLLLQVGIDTDGHRGETPGERAARVSEAAAAVLEGLAPFDEQVAHP